MMSSVTEIGKLFPLYLGTSLEILNELISLNLNKSERILSATIILADHA